MKKIISLLLLITLCLCLCACRKSDSVVAFENLVEEIGIVSLNSETAILAAEGAYRELSEKEQKSTTECYDYLKEKRSEYDKLLAAEVSTMIDSLGTVTLDSESSIKNARSLYNKLSNNSKMLVTNYSTLVDAEEMYETLLEKEKQKYIEQLKTNFIIKEDKFYNNKTYDHKKQPKGTCIYPCIYEKSASLHQISIKYIFSGYTPLYLSYVTIYIDGETQSIFPKESFHIVNDFDAGHEYFFVSLSFNQELHTEEIELLKAVGESKEAIIRYHGWRVYYDHEITDVEKQIIRDVLALYGAMIG